MHAALFPDIIVKMQSTEHKPFTLRDISCRKNWSGHLNEWLEHDAPLFYLYVRYHGGLKKRNLFGIGHNLLIELILASFLICPSLQKGRQGLSLRVAWEKEELKSVKDGSTSSTMRSVWCCEMHFSKVGAQLSRGRIVHHKESRLIIQNITRITASNAMVAIHSVD